MSGKKTRKQSVIVYLMETTGGLVAIISVAIGMWLMVGSHGLPEWARWLSLSIVIVGGTALSWLLFGLAKRYQEDHLKKTGHVRVLKTTIKEADRTVTTDVFEVTNDFATALSGSPTSGGYREVRVPWTRIRVTHRTETPCVMEVVAGNRKKIRLFDNNIYMEGKRQRGDWTKVPKKVKVDGRKVSTACPMETVRTVMDKAEHIFDDQDVAKVEGIIRIETRQVLFLQLGEWLEGEYLRMVVKLLLRLAEKTEKEYTWRVVRARI